MACQSMIDREHAFDYLLARLQQDLDGPLVQTSSSQGVRTLSVLIFIISLLGEHYDFDQLREENNPGE